MRSWTRPWTCSSARWALDQHQFRSRSQLFRSTETAAGLPQQPHDPVLSLRWCWRLLEAADLARALLMWRAGGHGEQDGVRHQHAGESVAVPRVRLPRGVPGQGLPPGWARADAGAGGCEALVDLPALHQSLRNSRRSPSRHALQQVSRCAFYHSLRQSHWRL